MKKLLAVLIGLSAITPVQAQTRPPVMIEPLGPWQMMTAQTHDDLPGSSGVYLLNTMTGELFVCVFAPGISTTTKGCLPMPKHP